MTTETESGRFNSILVQLEDVVRAAVTLACIGFNSILVQLEASLTKRSGSP